MDKVNLGNKEYSIARSKFKTWIELEEIQETLSQALDRDDMEEVGECILLYVSKSISTSINEIEHLPWKEMAVAYSATTEANHSIKILPFMKRTSKKNEREAEIWDYPGRVWFLYVNRIVEKYHWTMDYVSNLDVDDALSLIQEILVSEQLNKEWEWALSEKSSGYDEATKKSKFIEMPRPDWMKPVPKPPKVTKIPKFMLPVGNVIRYTENPSAVH